MQSSPDAAGCSDIGIAGTVVVAQVSGAFMVGATGFTDAGISHSEKVDVPPRPPDAVEELCVQPLPLPPPLAPSISQLSSITAMSSLSSSSSSDQQYFLPQTDAAAASAALPTVRRLQPIARIAGVCEQ